MHETLFGGKLNERKCTLEVAPKMFFKLCSVERTTLQLIHKEIAHKKITELNVLYLDS